MAIPKFFALVGAVQTLVAAAISTSAGAADADKIPALDASGRLDASFMPTGIGADTQVVTTSENLAAGALVNIYSNVGVFTARNADATAIGKDANGFVLAATTSGQNATIYGIGTNTGVTGLTPGKYYLSKTAGGITNDVSAYTTGNVIQEVGFSTAATELYFQPKAAFVV